MKVTLVVELGEVNLEGLKPKEWLHNASIAQQWLKDSHLEGEVIGIYDPECTDGEETYYEA